MMYLSRWADGLLTVVLLTLVAAAPFALGGVHRTAFVTLELLTFTLPGIWGLKIWSEAPGRPRFAVESRSWRRCALAILAVTVMLLLQLTPLPPRVLRAVTPGTYRIYQVSFPGWPATPPAQTVAPLLLNDRGSAAGLALDQSGPGSWFAHRRWRTLTLAPAVSAASLIEWLALATLFGVILLYPFGLVGEREAESRFYRSVVLGVLGLTAILCAIALCQLAWWNGKLLWLIVPQDWGKPMVGVPLRASGPFVDPDHFADFIAMTLPTAVLMALFPSPLVSRAHRANLRVGAALVALLDALALLFSLSRAGWIAAAAGTLAALLLVGQRLDSPQRSRRWGLIGVGVAAVGVMAATLFFAAGPQGRAMVAERVSLSLAGDDLSVRHRFEAVRDTLPMIADFPLFGVGLGAWPDLFRHYARPPWSPFFARQTGNDYVQFAAESGMVGVILAGWLVAAMIMALRAGRRLDPRRFPLFAGLCGGLLAVALHEAFDFSLHTPANAILLTVTLALAMRMALAPTAEPTTRLAARRSRRSYACAAAALVMAVALGALTLAQDGRAYPYGVSAVTDPIAAARLLLAHPAMSTAHLRLLALGGARITAATRFQQLAIAVWLDPNNPRARDAYARELLQFGREGAGLRAVTESVYRAPRLGLHDYLAPAAIPWLLPRQQDAVAAGFERAVGAGFPGASRELVTFYDALGRYVDSAHLCERLAAASRSLDDQVEYDVIAGREYASAGDTSAAQRALQRAIALAPADSRPYVELARAVDGPAGRLNELRATLAQGQRAGADPYALDLALADGAAVAGDRAIEESALREALTYRPSFALAMRLGDLYMAEGNFARAAAVFDDAAALENRAEAYLALGAAEEAQFDYVAAERAYARARALAPGDTHVAQVYAQFERRASASGEAAP
ncbi:MAG TPA: O-antigen ligase family protein [Candidatus Binataceae bacterium]|nr:O-antigen ligase family protein [Candidatus Binataceae bacterium]